MSRLRVQAILPASSNKTEDDCMNVWHFQTTAPPTEDQLLQVEQSLQTFYSDVRPRMSPAVQNVLRVRQFDLADVSPRAPIRENEVALSGAHLNTDQLPHELAIALSYYAAPTSGVPKGRRRGRVYIGPLNASCFDGEGEVTGATINEIINAAQNLYDNTTGTVLGGVSWELYSVVDDTMRQIVRVAVDNAFDIQRRRGHDATTREVVDLNP